MQKIKISALIVSVLAFASLLLASPARAVTTQVSIQQLPSYINTNSFYLSCSAISDSLTDGNPATTTTAQFSVSKDGGSYNNFGPSIDLSTTSCKVQVTDSQVTDEGTFNFKVTLDSGQSSQTSTIYDHNGPGTPSGYYKEGLSDGFRIHWTNPTDSDFARVIIYRGETPDFTADGSHEVTSQSGGGGSPMTYEDHFGPVPGKAYYYDLRAVDKAGNSSGLVGDGSSVTTTSSSSPAPAGSGGKVTVLPKEGTGGSVLGTEAGPTPQGTAASTSSTEDVNAIQKVGLLKWIITHKKISLGIAAGLALLGYGFYYFSKKK